MPPPTMKRCDLLANISRVKSVQLHTLVTLTLLHYLRGRPEMMSSIGGREVVSQKMTNDDQGEGGVSQKMTL